METLNKNKVNGGSLNEMNLKLLPTESSGIDSEESLNLRNDLDINHTEFAYNIQRELLDLFDGFYFVLNDNFIIKYISTSVVEKLGFSCEDIVGKHVEELLSEESSKQLKAFISLVISQGKTLEMKVRHEVEVINSKQEICYYQLSLVNLKHTDLIIGVFYDVHDIKIREKELIAAKNTAEFNDKLKSEFLANMSHEIRTPLNGIVGFTTMLNRKDLSEEKFEKYLRIIHSCTHHLLTLVSDIIDISKIEAGQLKIITNPIDVHQMLEDLQATFISEAGRLGKKNIRIVKQIEKPRARLSISGDEIRLKQVMINLLGNALKFTTEGDIRFGYTFPDSKTIQFFVRDSGIGLSKPAQKIIFNRFKQTKEGEKDIYKGNGLGLAISKGIIELMGGRIGVQSDSGEGAEFFFTLPYVECK